MAKRKYVQREIGMDPTIWLESNKLDPFRFGKDLTERKMPVVLSPMQKHKDEVVRFHTVEMGCLIHKYAFNTYKLHSGKCHLVSI